MTGAKVKHSNQPPSIAVERRSKRRWSSESIVYWASRVLNDPQSCPIDLKLAACVLSQRAKRSRQTSYELGFLASGVLLSKESTQISKRLAGSALSQRAPVAISA
jgi:hypothetical protein